MKLTLKLRNLYTYLTLEQYFNTTRPKHLFFPTWLQLKKYTWQRFLRLLDELKETHKNCLYFCMYHFYIHNASIKISVMTYLYSFYYNWSDILTFRIKFEIFSGELIYDGRILSKLMAWRPLLTFVTFPVCSFLTWPDQVMLHLNSYKVYPNFFGKEFFAPTLVTRILDTPNQELHIW